MKHFGTILRFELKNYLTNKIFVGVTVLLAVAIAVVMSFPRIAELFQSGGGDPSAEELPVMLIAADPAGNGAAALDAFAPGRGGAAILDAFAAAFPGYEVRAYAASLEELREEIASGSAECAFLLHSLTSYTYYIDDLSMYDVNTAVADEVLLSLYRMSAMVRGGLSAEDAGAILSAQIQHETEKLGKDQMENFFYTYIMIFALYMVILLYGQMVATSVATEKSSRAMELLITSAKPAAMMFGKVLASCIAGAAQLAAVFGSALLSFGLNRSYWEENAMVASIFDMPVDLFVYMLVFFVLGFLIYAFLFGAVGSTASKLEDINTSVMPITMLFIIGFFVVMFSMLDGNVDTLLMKICSFIPFTSPMAMFTRIAMTAVPFHEIAISIAILILSAAGVGLISAKIYRVGVLLYGTPPKLGSIVKAVLRA